jgi:hypothetical protein
VICAARSKRAAAAAGPILSAVLAAACAAGPASVEVTPRASEGLVHFEFQSEGKNTFSVGGHSCEAEPDTPCALDVPVAELQGGWNRVDVETRRRTGMASPLQARFFLGDDAFRRDCAVTETGDRADPASLGFELTCTFPEGLHGEVAGRPMPEGKASLRASEIPLDVDGQGLGVAQPVAVAEIPLVVVGKGGGRWPRPIRVVLPVPLTQLAVLGFRDPWYERTLPLQLRAEPGADLKLGGQSVPVPVAGEAFEHAVEVKPGRNTLRVEASAQGKVAAVHELELRGEWPATPLYLDEPATEHVTTFEKTIRIRGLTDPHARLYVSSRPVDLGSGGRFDLEIPLEEGLNDIELLAVVDPAPRVEPRPATKRSIQVRCRPLSDPAVQKALEKTGAGDSPDAVRAVAADPWAHEGEYLHFSMKIEEFSSSPAGKDGGCRGTLTGLLCSEEAARPVRVGYEEKQGRACLGELLPVVVETDECREADAGAWIRVVGKVVGGLGGRSGIRTVERPRIEALELRPAPRVEPK